jgi:hypothetical protein
MNSSGLVFNSPVLSSWAEDALYVACLLLGLYTIALFVCYVIVAAEGDSGSPTKKRPVAR